MDLPLVPSRSAPSSRLFIATNRFDLMEVLSSGMVSPAVASSKIFSRLASAAPGAVILLADPPASVLQWAEDPGMFAFPVLLEIDPVAFGRRTFPSVGADGSSRKRSVAAPAVRAWAIPSVVSYETVVAVHVRSAEDLETMKVDLKQYSNIRWELRSPAVSPDLFAKLGDSADGLIAWAIKVGSDIYVGPLLRKADRLAGGCLLAAAVTPGDGSSWQRIARVLGADPQLGDPNSGREWLAGLLPGEASEVEEDRRLFEVAVDQLIRVEIGESWNSTVVIEDIRAGLDLDHGPTEERTLRILGRMESIVRGDEVFGGFKAGQETVSKGLLLTLLEGSPQRLAERLELERGLSAQGRTVAGALMGVAWGQKAIPAELRPAALDRFLARRILRWIPGSVSPGKDDRRLTVEAGTGKTGVVRLKLGKETLMETKVVEVGLADLLVGADLMSLSQQVLADLCVAMGWADCVRITYLVEGQVSVRWDDEAARQAITFARPDGAGKVSIDTASLASRLQHSPVQPEIDEKFRALLFPTGR